MQHDDDDDDDDDDGTGDDNRACVHQCDYISEIDIVISIHLF